MNNTTKFLYHITEVGHLEAIRKNGLKCDSEGYIYLFEDKKFTDLMGIRGNVRDHIAINQICVFDKVGLLKIAVGDLLNQLEPDNVDESCAQFQYRIKMNLIPRDRIVNTEIVHVNNPWKEFFEKNHVEEVIGFPEE